jgi:hypothetical protein
MDPLIAMYIAAGSLVVAILVFVIEPFRKSKPRVIIAAPLVAITVCFGFIFFSKGGLALFS